MKLYIGYGRPLLPALVVAAAILSSGVANAHGDAVKGKENYKSRCADCHSLIDGDHKAGPSLQGVFGRRAGTTKGFFYSKYLKAAGEKGLVWNDKKMRAYITYPNGFLKKYLGVRRVKSKMKKRYKNHKLRHDVVEYLRQATK